MKTVWMVMALVLVSTNVFAVTKTVELCRVRALSAAAESVAKSNNINADEEQFRMEFAQFDDDKEQATANFVRVLEAYCASLDSSAKEIKNR